MLFFTICRLHDSKSSIKAPQQLLRAMKLTTLLLVAVNMNIWASGFGQKVTISGKDLPLEKVFSLIKKQTGYAFFYDYSIFQDTKPVTLNLKDADIEDAMRVCLWGQDLDFSITNKTISIVRKMFKKIEKIGGGDPEHTLKAQGIVLNEVGQPLSGATVAIRQIKKNTLTNIKGQFELNGIPSKSILEVSYIGYTTKHIVVESDNTIQVRLAVAINQLDETVVQAYGTTSRRLTTSNISVVTASEIEKQPIMNPLQALQGRVPGLDVVQTSGYGSAPFKVELRGRSSIGLPNRTFPSDPLYVIDGVPLTVLEIGNQSSYSNGSTGFIQTGVQFNGPANGQSPFFSINPADIESIEVLKDADATSIYGSRGANGVILITTKKGKSGKTKFDLHVQEGVNKVVRFYQLLNTRQYLQMRREAFLNDAMYGITPDLGNAYDLLQWDTTRNVNWARELYGGTGRNTDAQASLSGGDVRNTFRMGVGYANSKGITAVSGGDQRSSFSLNFTHRSFDQRLVVSFTGGYSFTKSDMINLPGSPTMSPNAPAIYDSVGNLNYKGWGEENSSARGAYPFASLKQPYTAKTNFLNTNLMVSFQAFKGLKLSTSFGYNTAQANQQQFVTIASQDPLTMPTGSSSWGYNSNKNWIIEPQATYDVLISRGKLNVMLGTSLQETNTDGVYLTGSGYTSDDLLRTISNAPSKNTSDNYGEYRYSAVFGRVNYSWENKYILNLNARRDGSSRFGINNQFSNFGSIGAAWIFTEEDWIKQNIAFLSFGKLRGSYGTTGSDAIGDYGYLTRWSSNNRQSYGGIQPLVPTQHANPNFKWQSNQKLEAAIDLGFFKDKYNLNVAFYRNRCGNQLVQFPLALMTGFSSVIANSPALVQNQGWEFNFSGRLIETKNFKWSFSFNTAINKNKLLAYPNLALSPYAGKLIIGRTLNLLRILHYTGVDPLTGQYTFEDKNHDGQISLDYSGKTSDDSYFYDLSPKFFGGLGMNFTYKNLLLSLFFNIKKQIGVNAVYQGSTAGDMGNQSTAVLTRWQKPGDITNIARYTTSGQSSDGLFKNASDGAYTDASYVRLSTLSLAYSMPNAYIKKIGMQSCSIFLHANNIFVITGYKGVDPETQNFGGLPPTRTIVGGLSFNF